jgi:glycosyltransferase involved in cell wall biosynthesis
MINKPLVIHIVNNLYVGGISSVLYSLLKDHQTSEYKYLIVNLSGNHDIDTIKKFKELEVEIFSYNFKNDFGYKIIDHIKQVFFIGNKISKNEKIINAIIALKPSIIHFHTLPIDLFIGRVIKTKLRCELVYSDHAARIKKYELSWIKRKVLSWFFIQYYKEFNIIAVGMAVYNYLIESKINKKARKIILINNKIKKNDVKINYGLKNIYNVIYIARIDQVKGHRDLILAWAQLPILNLNLHIIGNDELGGEIQNLSTKMNFNNKVSFIGSTNNINHFLEIADFAVFPSHKEGLPIALLEKMQAGIPIIVSDIDELTSIIKDNINGLVFKCHNINDLSQKIELMASNIDLRRKLGLEAIKTFESDFLLEESNNKKNEYERFYDSLIK